MCRIVGFWDLRFKREYSLEDIIIKMKLVLTYNGFVPNQTRRLKGFFLIIFQIGEQIITSFDYFLCLNCEEENGCKKS